jgi:hypothetical protein
MTTRANIVVMEGSDKFIFYQHADGYPEGVMPMLMWFIEEMKGGRIRNNVEQAAGWLIVYGRRELDRIMERAVLDNPENEESVHRLYGWKCGTIEPSVDIHGDIEYYYVVDLRKLTAKAYKVTRMPERRMSVLPSTYLKKIEEYNG